jgi:predicted RNase H-like HicB family nuclease
MTRYAAYLEVGSEGLCMAHVPDLPGCIVRAASRDEAMCRVPEAIRDYHMRLRPLRGAGIFKARCFDKSAFWAIIDSNSIT